MKSIDGHPAVDENGHPTAAGTARGFFEPVTQGRVKAQVITKPIERMRVAPVVIALIAAAGAPSASNLSQVPDGYYLAPAGPPLPDSLREVSHRGRFRVTVERTARDSHEKHLIELAERIMPPRDAIQRAASRVNAEGSVQALAEASRLPGDRWWWREWDGVLLPYALTGAALSHYIDRVHDLSRRSNPFAAYNRGVKHRASIEYTARVVRDAESAPFRVLLVVHFSFYCGPECAMEFTHTRTVDFDVDDQVVRVAGDREPTVTVS
jgi:hypothetical protein